MSAGDNRPEIRSLSRDECMALLARHHVGRVAFSFRDRVDIHPVHYALEDDWLYIRTSEGEKLTTITHHPWVAFEVDDVRGPFDWESAVAHGTVYRIDAHGPSPDPAAEARAKDLLRQVVPEMFTAEDPVPHRGVILRVAVREVSGRRASPTWNRAEGRDTSSY